MGKFISFVGLAFQTEMICKINNISRKKNCCSLGEIRNSAEFLKFYI